MEDTTEDRPETPAEQVSEPVLPPYAGPRTRNVLLVQLGLSIGLTIAGTLLFTVLVHWFGWDTSVLNGVLAPDASWEERWHMRLLLVISHLATFGVAGWMTVRMFYPPARHALEYLRAETLPQGRDLLSGVLLMFLSMPLVLFLYNINKALPLPDLFHILEEQTNDAIKGLLQMDNGWELLANLVLIALLPAIGEELVFRGVLQQQLMRRIAQPWVAILLTAAIFSFIHFQFEGFLPRMLLGILLGWLYWRTQNFWVPATAHFANNAFQVVGQYLYSREISTVDLEQDVEVHWLAALLSVLLVLALMRWMVIRKQLQ